MVAQKALLFFSGLGLLIHEAMREGAERPTLLLAFLAMMGLPAFFPARSERDGG